MALLVEDGERQAEVIAALSNSFATDPRDWGSSGARDAWRYGVVCGWREVDDDDRDVLDEIAKRFPLIAPCAQCRRRVRLRLQLMGAQERR